MRDLKFNQDGSFKKLSRDQMKQITGGDNSSVYTCVCDAWPYAFCSWNVDPDEVMTSSEIDDMMDECCLGTQHTDGAMCFPGPIGSLGDG